MLLWPESALPAFARLFLIWLGVLSAVLFALYAWARCKLPAPGHAGYRRRGGASTSSSPSSSPSSAQPTTVGFFHPFANTAGGGERVLWCAIKALEEQHACDPARPYHVLVYTGDNDATPEDILARAEGRFGIAFTGAMPIEFVYLQKRDWILASGYRRFTLLGQSLGSVVLAFEALQLALPDAFVDSTGFAFTYPLAKFVGGCRVVTYTHYPTISTDMLKMVFSRRPSYNNDAAVAGSTFASGIKYVYYWIFAGMYRFAGKFADLVMVNSTWTYGHIASLWGGEATHIVYPPCDVEGMAKFPLDDVGRNKRKLFISIGQFRPEKDHALQLRAVHALLERYGGEEGNRDALSQARLFLIGSCRDDGDRARVEKLRALVQELDIGKYVEFKLNAPYADLCRWLSEATAGLHTMWNEHFGIGVVEMQTAGCVPIAHNSGGPKADIVVPLYVKRSEDGPEIAVPSGLRAETPEEYADAMAYILGLENISEQRLPEWARGGDGRKWSTLEMREAGRKGAERFSETRFKNAFKSLTEPVFSAVAPLLQTTVGQRN
jgi:alpha-1,2-mannosyltransferase